MILYFVKVRNPETNKVERMYTTFKSLRDDRVKTGNWYGFKIVGSGSCWVQQ